MSLSSASEMDVPLKGVSPVDIRVQDLSVQVKSTLNIWSHGQQIFGAENGKIPSRHSRVVLDEVSADMAAGSLTAILGSSGSGKTTLLNAIANRVSRKSMEVSGDVTFNGHSDLKEVRSAYVIQDDILLPTLTIRETLQYAVDLRLPLRFTKAERDAVVEDTILELGLKECADAKIGTTENSQCSGGEKRRTSIGVQLLANPSILFCDEPTTGKLCF